MNFKEQEIEIHLNDQKSTIKFKFRFKPSQKIKQIKKKLLQEIEISNYKDIFLYYDDILTENSKLISYYIALSDKNKFKNNKANEKDSMYTFYYNIMHSELNPSISACNPSSSSIHNDLFSYFSFSYPFSIHSDSVTTSSSRSSEIISVSNTSNSFSHNDFLNSCGEEKESEKNYIAETLYNNCNDEECKKLLKNTQESLLYLNNKPLETNKFDCSGGVYFFSSPTSSTSFFSPPFSTSINYISVFKPQDEEQGMPFNKKGYNKTSLRDSFKPGSGYLKEYAAYLIDCEDHFFKVPPTTIVYFQHNSFNYLNMVGEDEKKLKNSSLFPKLGSLQKFIKSSFTYDEISESLLTSFEVQKIALFDMLILNSDRNSSNILVIKKENCKTSDSSFTFKSKSSDDKYELIPIDHGYCFPSRLFIEEIDWVWFNSAYLKEEIDKDLSDYFLSINFSNILDRLRKISFPKESLRLLKIMKIFLSIGIKKNFNLRELAEFIARVKPNISSPLELLLNKLDSLQDEIKEDMLIDKINEFFEIRNLEKSDNIEVNEKYKEIEGEEENEYEDENENDNNEVDEQYKGKNKRIFARINKRIKYKDIFNNENKNNNETLEKNDLFKFRPLPPPPFPKFQSNHPIDENLLFDKFTFNPLITHKEEKKIDKNYIEELEHQRKYEHGDENEEDYLSSSTRTSLPLNENINLKTQLTTLNSITLYCHSGRISRVSSFNDLCIDSLSSLSLINSLSQPILSRGVSLSTYSIGEKKKEREKEKVR